MKTITLLSLTFVTLLTTTAEAATCADYFRARKRAVQQRNSREVRRLDSYFRRCNQRPQRNRHDDDSEGYTMPNDAENKRRAEENLEHFLQEQRDRKIKELCEANPGAC
jgi:hypothetical protein